jgi:hypothetical protein
VVNPLMGSPRCRDAHDTRPWVAVGRAGGTPTELPPRPRPAAGVGPCKFKVSGIGNYDAGQKLCPRNISDVERLYQIKRREHFHIGKTEGARKNFFRERKLRHRALERPAQLELAAIGANLGNLPRRRATEQKPISCSMVDKNRWTCRPARSATRHPVCSAAPAAQSDDSLQLSVRSAVCSVFNVSDDRSLASHHAFGRLSLFAARRVAANLMLRLQRARGKRRRAYGPNGEDVCAWWCAACPAYMVGSFAASPSLLRNATYVVKLSNLRLSLSFPARSACATSLTLRRCGGAG